MASLDNTLGAFTLGGGAGRAITTQRAYDAGVRAGKTDYDAYADGESLHTIIDAWDRRVRGHGDRTDAFVRGWCAGWELRLRSER